jgi:hypothetical protein
MIVNFGILSSDAPWSASVRHILAFLRNDWAWRGTIIVEGPWARAIGDSFALPARANNDNGAP